jgi:hypothetical protein
VVGDVVQKKIYCVLSNNTTLDNTTIGVTTKCSIVSQIGNSCMLVIIVCNGEIVVSFKSTSINSFYETYVNSINDIAMSPPS